MDDRILTILSRLRRKLLAVRSAEAAAVGGTAGGLIAVPLMAGWILAGRHPAAAVGLSALPLLGGVALAASGRPGRRCVPEPPLRRLVAILATLLGAAAAAAILTGAFQRVPKNALLLIVPASGLLAAGVVACARPSLRTVAATADQRAGLRERLRTACELAEARDDSTFARAVRDQALTAENRGELAHLPFWRRGRPTAAALTLALLAAGLMLPWRPLESPEAARRRQWRQAAPQAGEALLERLASLAAGDLADRAGIAAEVRRLRELAEQLASARADRAHRWHEHVLDLEEVIRSLRRVARSDRLDAAEAAELARLIEALERVADDVAEAMAGSGGADLARVRDDGEPARRAGTSQRQAALPGYASVYHPGYRRWAEPATTVASSRPAPPPDASAPEAIPYDQAWAAARRRAEQALDRQAIPRQYRQLVRDFFSADR